MRGREREREREREIEIERERVLNEVARREAESQVLTIDKL